MLPHVLLLARMIRFLPRAVYFMLHDNISLEDAPGRVRSLQFQEFKHWNVFEASLRKNFHGVHGSEKVLKGQFILTCPKLPGRELGKSNWDRNVLPWIAVTMVINMNAVQSLENEYPKCSSNISSKNIRVWSTDGSPRGTCDLCFPHGLQDKCPVVFWGPAFASLSGIDLK
jgi:hypothetical protein